MARKPPVQRVNKGTPSPVVTVGTVMRKPTPAAVPPAKVTRPMPGSPVVSSRISGLGNGGGKRAKVRSPR